MNDAPPSVRIIGAGRAGGSFALALSAVGWSVELVGRGPGASDGPASPGRSSSAEHLILLCVPDSAVAAAAASLRPSAHTVVLHCSGSLGLDVLGSHPRVGSVHPLVALAAPETGAARLRGAWFAISGDPSANTIARALGGRTVHVGDADRARYHAAAVIASNHLVALMGQVERLARTIDVPLEAYLGLARGALDDVARVGPAAALTGPVARGDLATVDAHLAALPGDERDSYRALAEAAARLVGRDLGGAAGGDAADDVDRSG